MTPELQRLLWSLQLRIPSLGRLVGLTHPGGFLPSMDANAIELLKDSPARAASLARQIPGMLTQKIMTYLPTGAELNTPMIPPVPSSVIQRMLQQFQPPQG